MAVPHKYIKSMYSVLLVHNRITLKILALKKILNFFLLNITQNICIHAPLVSLGKDRNNLAELGNLKRGKQTILRCLHEGWKNRNFRYVFTRSPP